MTMMLESFHLLRPWWLLAAVPAIIIWWFIVRGRDPRQSFKEQIATHLLDELLVAPKEPPRIRPVTLLLPLWLIGILALTGPSWRQQPAPFAEDQAGLMLIMKMTPSMMAQDVHPSRLDRTRHKVHDLLQLRAGGKNGLIVYSGGAHLVLPFTNDTDVIEHMLEAVNPSVMPHEGDALASALSLASRRIVDSGRPASILLITDGVEPSQFESLAQWREENSISVQVYAPVADAATVSASGVKQAARELDAPTIRLAPNESDVVTMNRHAASAVVAAADENGDRWRDDGFYLVPILLLGIMVWSRRGWSVSTDD